MNLPVLVSVIGATATLTFISAAHEPKTLHLAGLDARHQTAVGNGKAYAAVFQPETNLGLVTGVNSNVLGTASPRTQSSTPDAGSHPATGHAEVPGLSSAPDCAGGICTIYSNDGLPPIPDLGASSDQLHVRIASVPTTNGAKSFDLIGTKGNLASGPRTAFDLGAEDFNSSGSANNGSGDALAAPDTSAYWQMQ